MMNQNRIGWALILTAVALYLQNLADAIADLQNWHGLTTTAFVAIAIKQGATVALAVLGGKMQKPFGGEK